MQSTTNLRLDEKKLRRIIKEELLTSKVLSKPKLTKAVSGSFKFDRQTVNSMLESGFFTLQEEAALKALLKHDRFQRLNESTMRRLDKKVKKLVKESTLLSESLEQEIYVEAFGDFFKKVKDKVKGAAGAVGRAAGAVGRGVKGAVDAYSGAKQQVTDYVTDTAGKVAGQLKGINTKNYKEKLSGAFGQAKEALAGGWAKLKKIWGQFSDVCKQVCSLLVDSFKKLVSSVVQKAKSWASKQKANAIKKAQDIANDQNKKLALKKETEHFGTMTDYWSGKITEFYINGAGWVGKVLSGEGAPGALDTEGDTKKESVRNDIASLDFGDPFFLNEIYSGFKKRSLNEVETMSYDFGRVSDEERKADAEKHGKKEGFHGLHLEDYIKNPTGRKIINVIFKLIEFLFSPMAEMAKYVLKAVGPHFYDGLAIATQKLGGPQAIKYFALSALTVDALVTLMDAGGFLHMPGTHWLHKTLLEVLEKAVPAIGVIIKVGQGIACAYAAINFGITIIDIFKNDGAMRKSLGLDDHGSHGGGHGQGGQAKAAH